MPTYYYQKVYIGNMDLRSSLRFSDRISCNVYDLRGSLTNNYHNGSIYDLVIIQDIVDGEPQVDLAICETVKKQGPRFTLCHGNCSTQGSTQGRNMCDTKMDNPALTPFQPGVATPCSDFFAVPSEPLLPGVPAPCDYKVPSYVPSSIFEELEHCELLVLFTGGYIVIKQGWNMPDDASKKKIANLYEAMALLTGY